MGRNYRATKIDVKTALVPAAAHGINLHYTNPMFQNYVVLGKAEAGSEGGKERAKREIGKGVENGT